MLICLSNKPKHAFVIRDAQKLGIHCLVSGTPHLQLGVPGVSEDNRQAMRLAVQHLVDNGHRRIALVIQAHNEPWTLQRHEAFMDVVDEFGLHSAEQIVHWVPLCDSSRSDKTSLGSLVRFVDRTRPTGIVAGSYLPLQLIDQLHESGHVRVPQDISVISFEQNLASTRWFHGLRVAHVKFPMLQMGWLLAEKAPALTENLPVEHWSLLPAELVSAKSVLDHCAVGVACNSGASNM